MSHCRNYKKRDHLCLLQILHYFYLSRIIFVFRRPLVVQQIHNDNSKLTDLEGFPIENSNSPINYSNVLHLFRG